MTGEIASIFLGLADEWRDDFEQIAAVSLVQPSKAWQTWRVNIRPTRQPEAAPITLWEEDGAIKLHMGDRTEILVDSEDELMRHDVDELVRGVVGNGMYETYLWKLFSRGDVGRATARSFPFRIRSWPGYGDTVPDGTP